MNKRSRAEAETLIHNSLVRLSAARREKLSDEDYDVFADGLIEFPPAIVARVCDELGRIAPDEFQPRFPPLHVIREQCHRVVEHERAKQLQRMFPMRQHVEPISDEKLEAFKAQIRKFCKKRVLR